VALWLKDADNSFPLYTDEYTEALGGDLYYALWDGSAWISPTLAVSGVSSDEAPQFARDGDASLAVWSQDADGSIETITDTAISYAAWISPTWSAAQTLSGAGDGLADFSPRVAYDSTGRANLVWVKGRVAQSEDPDDAVDQLYFATYDGGAWSSPALAVEAAGILGPKLLVDSQDNLVVLWEGRSDEGRDVWYAVYDRGDGAWGKPIHFTHDEDAETDYDAVIDSSDTLRVVLTGREVVTTTHPSNAVQGAGLLAPTEVIYPTFGGLRPSEQQHTLGHDLTVDGLVVEPANPAPGSTALLTATVRNSGDLAVSPVRVAFSQRGYFDDAPTQVGVTQTLPITLTAGYTATVNVTWTVPITAEVYTLSATVDPGNEVAELSETNNTFTTTTVLPDLVIDWARTTQQESGLVVEGGVRNGGVTDIVTPFTVTLRADDAITGTAVLSNTVAWGLAAGEGVTVTLTLTDPAAMLAGAHIGWLVADSTSAIAEFSEDNNTAFTVLDALPDLWLTAEDIQAGSPLSVTVHNGGYVTATNAVVEGRQDAITRTLLISGTVASIAPGGTGVITTTLDDGSYTLYAHADPAAAIAEIDESNNLAVRTVRVCTLTADFDLSGRVDIADIMDLVRRWGASPGDGLYDKTYDLVYDGVIDIADIQQAAAEWRRSC